MVIQRHYKNSHAFIFIAMLVYFMFYSIFKNNKNIQITKNHKKIIFIINLDFQSSDRPFLFSFLIKYQINFNHTLSLFSFNIKNTNQFSFATWLFILKPFQKLIKKHTTNQTSISTPNYEVLIPHGYVGRGHSSFQINKM